MHMTTITLLTSQFNSYDSQLVKSSAHLEITKAYIATDAEWSSMCAWVTGFSNWLQSASVLSYYNPKLEKWQWHLFLFTSSTLPESKLQLIRDAFGDDDRVTLVFQHLPFHAEVVEQWIKEHELKVKTIEIIGKFSPLDYHAYLGESIWMQLVNENKVSHKRCLRFEVKNSRKSKRLFKPESLNFDYCLRDIQGLNTSNLKKQGEAVGVKLFAKDLAGAYVRGRMREAYEKVTLEATTYNICDAFAAMQITLAYIPLVNEIITQLGLPASEHITLETLSHTTGSLVGRVFCSFIEFYPVVLAHHNKLALEGAALEKFTTEWRLILWKNAKKSDKLDTRETRIANDIIRGQLKCKTLDDYDDYLIDIGYKKGETEETLTNVVLNTRLMSRLFQASLYQQACSKVLGSNTEATSVFAALVQGGRCNNSCPFESRVKRVLDVDMSSCYGSTLRKLKYPIGLPSIYSRSLTFGEKLEPFQEVYERLEAELVNDLWIADVSTKTNLKFCQDLLFSSYGLTPEKIRKAVTGVSHYEEDYEGFIELIENLGDVKKIPSDFVLTRKQLEHARICSSSKRVLDAVANKPEKPDLAKKLECATLVYYPKSQQFTEIEAFVKHMMIAKGTVTTDASNNVTDARSRAWYGLDLELFIGVLVNIRKKLKTAMKSATGDTKNALNAKQEMYKLFINTLYGDLASVYFSFGNVVLANVITDKARVGAWMMSKALRTRMEITDGGFYSPLAVAFNRGDSLPGFSVFSDWKEWAKLNERDKVERTIGCLGETTPQFWEEYFRTYNRRIVDLTEAYDLKEMHKLNGITDSLVETLACAEGTEALDALVDQLAKEHITNFWKPYGLEFEFGIEHKYEHISWAAGYTSKSDYCLLTLGNTPNVIKKRGSRLTGADIPMSERNEEYYRAQDPAFEFLEGLARGDTRAYNHRGFDSNRIIKVSEYQLAPVEKTVVESPQTLAEHKTKETIVPGWELTQAREPRQINNGHIYLETFEDYDTINRRAPYDKGKRVAFFERYINDASKFTEEMAENRLDVAQKARREEISKRAQERKATKGKTKVAK